MYSIIQNKMIFVEEEWLKTNIFGLKGFKFTVELKVSRSMNLNLPKNV